MKKITVAVLFGGVSSEHDVSLISAKSVIENIPKDKYDVIMLGITKDGRWLLYSGDTNALPDSSWENDSRNKRAFISPDTSVHGIVVSDGEKSQCIKLDAVFPVLHGANGEDGTMQGLLTIAQIPFVGCGCASSAVCMDKMFEKCILDAAGIRQAKWDYTNITDYNSDALTVLDRIEKKLGYPIFVKPANAGSSVGITKAHNRDELKTAIKTAGAHDRKIVFEEMVDGHEVECAVLGNDDPQVSCVGEIVPCNEFYDYDAKYLAGKTELEIPSKLPQEKTNEIREIAKRAYRLLDCKGLTRMDFFVRKSDGSVLLNEPNTIPGFTSISMYPKLFEACGISYPELLDKILTFALEK
ncbi:MAG TPA: D-alanine--D-alanine ligase family protein [Ruminiclostridium sp.]|nr:D-alanine--D-alanine ligase family protein [Ruminiclostridium sp.]